MRILTILSLSLLSLGLHAMPAEDSQFECNAVYPLRHQTEDSIKITGTLTAAGSIENIVLTLSHRVDSSQHEILSADGPISPDLNFHPKNPKLQGYQKYILEHDDDAFFFFLRPLNEDKSTAYVKLYFDGTYPDLEPVKCQFK